MATLGLLAAPGIAFAQNGSLSAQPAPAQCFSINNGERIALGVSAIVLGGAGLASGVALAQGRGRGNGEGFGALYDGGTYVMFGLGGLVLGGGVWVLASPGLSRPCPHPAQVSRAGVGSGMWLWPREPQ